MTPTYLAHADLGRLPSLLSLDADTAADPIAVIVRQAAARANPPGPVPPRPPAGPDRRPLRAGRTCAAA